MLIYDIIINMFCIENLKIPTYVILLISISIIYYNSVKI